MKGEQRNYKKQAITHRWIAERGQYWYKFYGL